MTVEFRGLPFPTAVGFDRSLIVSIVYLGTAVVAVMVVFVGKDVTV